jgi:hypothetical protein
MVTVVGAGGGATPVGVGTATVGVGAGALVWTAGCFAGPGVGRAAGVDCSLAGTSLAARAGVAVAPSIEDSGDGETMETGRLLDVGAGDGPRLPHAQSVIATRPRVASLTA